jgi:hypothetical protein
MLVGSSMRASQIDAILPTRDGEATLSTQAGHGDLSQRGTRYSCPGAVSESHGVIRAV